MAAFVRNKLMMMMNVGGSEKNGLITGADVRTGDLLPSRMRVAVLSTGQRLRRRRTAGCWPMCQRGASSSRLSRNGVLYRRCCTRPQMR